MFDKSKYQAAVFCIKKASLIGSSCADLGAICDILLSVLAQVAKLKTGFLDTRRNYLCRALHKYPNHNILWKSLMEEDSKDKNRNKKILITSDENSALIQLAIDHVLKMILS